MEMGRRLRTIAVFLCCLLMAAPCISDTIWDYEAVNADGTGSHPLAGADPVPANRVTIEGIALAGVDELWDPTSMYTAFVQDDTAIKGGLQAWAGKWWYGSAWRPADYPDFQAGDRVRIVGLLENHNGKVFINDRHSGSTDTRFTVTVLGHPGLPDPELLASVSICNHFDQTRADGAERYQTRLIVLHGVQFASGAWTNNSQPTVSDTTGSVDIWLSSMGNFTGTAQPADRFSVVGIMDQEDTAAPFTDSYRVLVKKYEDIALSLDACRQARDHQGERVALVNKVVSRAFDDYFYIQDPDRTGGIRISSSRLLVPGDVISVMGTVEASGNEVSITPRYLTLCKCSPKPLLVNSATLWGESGLDVGGLLVRCTGTLGTDQGDGTYTLIDDAGKTVQIKTNGVTMPAQGARVAVTAVATKNAAGVPVMLLANLHDIQIVD